MNLLLSLVKRLPLFVLGMFLAASSPASEADFRAANELYEQRQFAEAAAAYEKLITGGTVSPNVYFNLGNARFKLGEVGPAIAAYRRAQQLAPRDPDIRANLKFARDKTGNTGAEPPPESWPQRLTSNEWTLLACIPLWICFLLLAFAQLRPAWQKAVRGYAIVPGVLAVGFGICAGIAAQHQSRQAAVVIADEAVVRHGPFNDSPSAFSLREGAELLVIDQRENWIRVSAGPNRIGWVPAAQVTVIN